MHILGPSPYFKDHYVPLYWPSTPIPSFIISYKPFELTSDHAKIRISHEEMGFSVQMVRYRLFYLESSLDYDQVSGESVSAPGDVDLRQLKTRDACLKWLEERGVDAKRVIEMCREFQARYLYVRGYFSDFTAKLRQLHTNIFTSLRYEIQDRKLLGAVVERVIWFEVYELSWPNVLGEFETKDAMYRDLFSKNQDKNMHDFGLSRKLEGLEKFLNTTIDEIRALDRNHEVIPSARADQLTSVFESFSGCVTALLDSREESEEYLLSADDTLPIVIYVCVRAQPRHMYTWFKLIQARIFSESMDAQTEYAITSFDIALQYLVSTDTDDHTATETPGLTKRRLELVSRLKRSDPNTKLDEHRHLIPSMPTPAAEQHQDDESDFLKQLKQLEDGTSSTSISRP